MSVFSAFLYYVSYVDYLFSCPSAFTEPCLLIWDLGLQFDFHSSANHIQKYFACMTNQADRSMIRTFFQISLLWQWYKNSSTPVLRPLPTIPNMATETPHQVYTFFTCSLPHLGSQVVKARGLSSWGLNTFPHGDLIHLYKSFPLTGYFSCWPSSTSLTTVTASHASSHLVLMIIVIIITVTFWELSIFSLSHPTWVNSLQPPHRSRVHSPAACFIIRHDQHQIHINRTHLTSTFSQRIATGATCNRPKYANVGHRHHPRHRSCSSSLATSDALSYRDSRKCEHDFDLFCTESAQLSCEVRIQPHIFAFPDCGSSSSSLPRWLFANSLDVLFIAIAIFSHLFTTPMSS